MKSYHLFCLLLFNVRRNHANDTCEPDFLEKCIKMGKEFFDQPENIFPANSSDINRVCSDVFPKMWSDFVGCTKSFAASCISSTELSQFNRAVGNSINSVHKMCTNEDYQRDYLKSAICIKKAAIEEQGCKTFYDELLQEINSPSETTTLCCAHTAFKDCLMEETKSCSCQDDTCQATTFARTIVENAIGFLLNRCSKSSSRIDNVCQKFIPPVLENKESHYVDEGNYFPSLVIQSSAEVETSASPQTVATSASSNDESGGISDHRMPKQDNVMEETRAAPATERTRKDTIKNDAAVASSSQEDGSINFDEFFDLEMYKRQFLGSSGSSGIVVTNLLVMILSGVLSVVVLSH